MAEAIGDLMVRVGADVTSLRAGLNSGSKSVGDFSSKAGAKLKSVSKNIAAVGAASVAAGAAMIAGLYKKGADVIDQQAKVARTLGSTTASVQALHRAADLAGISQESMAGASAKLNARLGEAMRGAGAAADQLERMGLNAEQLAGMEADERMATLADRMVELGYSSAQAADAMRQLGIREEKMAGLMLDGGASFRAAREEVEKYGIAVSDVDAAKVEAANDAITSMSATMSGVANTVAVELSPFIAELGTRFGEASKESGGFKSSIQNVIGVALKGFGYFANVLHGIRVAFKGLQYVALVFGDAINSTVLSAAEGVSRFGDNVIADVNRIIEGLNQIPGVDIAKVDFISDSPFMDGLRNMAQSSRDAAHQVLAEFNALALQPLPKENIDKFLAEVEKRADETAQKLVETRKKAGGDEGGGLGLSEEDRKALDAKVEAIRQSNQTELELLREKNLAEREVLADALANKAIDEETYLAQLGGLRKQYQDEYNAVEQAAADKRDAIAQREAESRRAAVSDMWGNLSTLMNSESRKMFQIGKLAAQSQTVLSTYEGAQKAYAALAGIPVIGPALGTAAAAAAILAGQQRLSAIRAQSFGGGGAGAVATGSNTAAVNAATTPVQQGGGSSVRTFNIEGLSDGRNYSGGEVRRMATALEEFWRDGGGQGRTIFA